MPTRCQMIDARGQMTEAFEYGSWIAECGMVKQRAESIAFTDDRCQSTEARCVVSGVSVQISGTGCQI